MSTTVIPGLCRIWVRLRSQSYWTSMCHGARGFTECVDLIDHYQDKFPGMYDYEITADSDSCRPLAVFS